MSQLREQLDQAREQYREQRYPGNLAGDVLDHGQGPGVIFRIGAAGAALAGLAAALAMWVATRPAPPQSLEPAQTVAIAPTTAPDTVADVSTTLSSFSSTSTFPQSIPLSPASIETEGIGSMPSMPSLGVSLSPAGLDSPGGSDTTGSGSTTKESV